jgi:hypothetical protein
MCNYNASLPNVKNFFRQGQPLEYFTIVYSTPEDLVSTVAGLIAGSVFRIVQNCLFWKTYRKTATLRLASKWISDVNTLTGGMAPATRAVTSPMKPNAQTTVSKVMPINAKNAAFLRVMPGSIHPSASALVAFPTTSSMPR